MSLIAPIKCDVIRRTQAITNGRPVLSVATVFVDVEMSVQPLSGRDLQILSEGDRTAETIKIYTPFQFQNADQHDNLIADLIELPDGRYFEVFNVAPYGLLLGRIRAFARRLAE